MLIIPSIDIFENKVVRLTKGDFKNISYYRNSPLDQAKLYESFGFELIHIVDLQASKTGEFTSLEIVRKIKQTTNLKIQLGGGIRTLEDAEKIIASGIEFTVIGSLAVKNKIEFEKIASAYPGKIIAAADVLNEEIRISGWTEGSHIYVYDHINYCKELGLDKFLITDISRDGMLSGTNKSLYKTIISKFPGIELIASGGIKDLEDIKNLKEINPYAVIVGKAIYENKIDLKELAEFALQKNNPLS